MVPKQGSLRERVFAFWKMHRRKNKSFTVDHFVAEGYKYKVFMKYLKDVLESKQQKEKLDLD
jgi:hypothetical protein